MREDVCRLSLFLSITGSYENQTCLWIHFARLRCWTLGCNVAERNSSQSVTDFSFVFSLLALLLFMLRKRLKCLDSHCTVPYLLYFRNGMEIFRVAWMFWKIQMYYITKPFCVNIFWQKPKWNVIFKPSGLESSAIPQFIQWPLVAIRGIVEWLTPVQRDKVKRGWVK